MSDQSIQCWQCGTRMTLKELASNDGDCPRCEVEIALDEYLSNAMDSNDALRAELAALKAPAVAGDEQPATVKNSLTVQPMAYAVFSDNGNVICFSTQRDHPSLAALESEGGSVVSLAPIAQTPADGQTFMGEPLIQSYEAPRKQVNELFTLLGFKGQAEVGAILDAAISAIKAAQPADGLVEALEHARLFIRNGVELGYIQMPDVDTPDPAHDTLPKIDAAIAAHRAQGDNE